MNKFRSFIPIMFVIILFSISIIAIATDLRRYGLSSILAYLEGISEGRKLLAILLTGLDYSLMTNYDFLGFIHIKQKLSVMKIAFTAFVSYAVGNTVGFSAISGTAIRYRYYGFWGVNKIKIAELIVFTHLTFWIGLLSVSGMVSVLHPITLPTVINLPFTNTRPLGFVFLLIVLIYFVISATLKRPFRFRGEEITFPKPIISFATIVVSTLDWGLAAFVLYLLLPINTSISYSSFFIIYVLALTAGLISTVPGGLGVFETVMLYSRPESITAPQMIGSLVAYRFVYFFLPLIIALAMILWETCHQKNQ